MKKKLVLLSALAVLAVATLTGCCKHEWAEATCKAPKTCSLCGKTEGEVVDHAWVEATCDAPKTCSVCGETEGEALGHQYSEAGYMTPGVCSVCGAESPVKAKYAEEKGMNFLDYIPETFEAPYMIYNPDQREDYEMKTGTRSLSVDIADGENDTKVYTITTEMTLVCTYNEPSGRDLYSCMYNDGIFDVYTGTWLNGRSTSGDDGYENVQVINIDGTDYEIKFSADIKWDGTDWYWVSEEDAQRDDSVIKTYVVTVPKDYDGLGYGTVPLSRNYTQEEYDTEWSKGIEDEINYIDYLGDCGNLDPMNGTFIWLKK